MSIFRPLYLKFVKKHFQKPFKPLGIKKKTNILVSAPATTKEFLKTLPFLAELSSISHVILLVPKIIEELLKILKPKMFEVIYYNKPLAVQTKEFTVLKNQLSKLAFSFVIELNRPANLSLPLITKADRRMTFYDTSSYPYYNILVKGDTEGFLDFFQLEPKEVLGYFRFYVRELKKIDKQLKKNRPLLFINGSVPANITWEGDTILLGKNQARSDETFKLLYLCDAYSGPDDELGELARIFNKRIVTS